MTRGSEVALPHAAQAVIKSSFLMTLSPGSSEGEGTRARVSGSKDYGPKAAGVAGCAFEIGEDAADAAGVPGVVQTLFENLDAGFGRTGGRWRQQRGYQQDSEQDSGAHRHASLVECEYDFARSIKRHAVHHALVTDKLRAEHELRCGNWNAALSNCAQLSAFGSAQLVEQRVA
jgi:hypothetical protein